MRTQNSASLKIAFTICANNYLAHAKTLGDSYLTHHPDHKFIIGLVDKMTDQLDFSDFDRFEIIPVTSLKMENFVELNQKYNITELCTAVKPRYFKYIFEHYKAETVTYLDPDILVLSPLEELYELLKTTNIGITPHMCSPVDDAFSPNDIHVLPGGVYNLGFIGLSDYPKVKSFLDWWDDRVVKYGYKDNCKGMFYDQVWINYVPCFYDNYGIIKHRGYNMANWNFHERTLSHNQAGNYVVNQNEMLRFFHFSSYKFGEKDKISWYHSRYDFDNRPDLKDIFYQYHDLLRSNKAGQISDWPTYYYPKAENQKQEQVKSSGNSLFKKVARRLKLAARVLIKGK